MTSARAGHGSPWNSTSTEQIPVETGLIERSEDPGEIDLAGTGGREIPDARTADLVFDVHVPNHIGRGEDVFFGPDASVEDDIAGVVVDADVGLADILNQLL